LFLLKNVTKSYAQNIIINNLSFQFTEDRYCISGPNGCGKSTLLMLMSGIDNVSLGSIFFNEQSVSSLSVKHKIGVSSDKILYPDFLTPQQLLTFHCTQYCCPFPDEIIKSLNFMPQLATKVAQLSLGNLKKLSLLLALCHKPLSLLLDEPTTGLDNESKLWLIAYLKSYKGQIITASHEESFMSNSTYEQIDLVELNTKAIN
jgi:ABC-type multidrug transport system ATPase subunit